MRFVAYGVIEPLIHIPPNELQRRHTTDPLAIGLPERAVDRLPRFRVRTFAVRADAADHLTDPCLSKVASHQPVLTGLDTQARVRVDDAGPVPPGASQVVCMPPKVGELPFVASDDEQRRARTDILLPAGAGAPVVLP